MRGSFLVQLTLGILLPLLWSQGGCHDPQPSYDEAFSEGVRESEAGHHAEALAMLKMAADTDPERPEPSYEMGRCFLAMADEQFVEGDLPGALRYCDRAIAAFDKAVAAFPGYSRAVQGKADALKLRGRHRAALDIANWVAAQSGFQAKKLVLKARQYADQGDLDNAQLAYKQAATVEPDNPMAHGELGLFYMRMNNRPEAIRSLSRAYELDPGAPGVFAALIDLGAVPKYPDDK
jgi:tetratricopeptide (TPR) repeat protein